MRKKPKSARSRVESTFDADSQQADVVQYIEWLRSSISDCTASLRKNVLIILLLIAAFELVLESPGSEITLGSFQLHKGSVILLFVPVVVACLCIQAVMDSNRMHDLSAAFETAFSKWSEKGHENDLMSLIYPSPPIYWMMISSIIETKQNRPHTRIVELFLGGAIGISILLGTMIFEFQAYFSLRKQTHGNIHTLWIACSCVSAVLMVGVLALMSPDRED